MSHRLRGSHRTLLLPPPDSSGQRQLGTAPALGKRPLPDPLSVEHGQPTLEQDLGTADQRKKKPSWFLGSQRDESQQDEAGRNEEAAAVDY